MSSLRLGLVSRVTATEVPQSASRWDHATPSPEAPEVTEAEGVIKGARGLNSPSPDPSTRTLLLQETRLSAISHQSQLSIPAKPQEMPSCQKPKRL